MDETEPIAAEDLPSVSLDMKLPEEVETPFFAREDLGFDVNTFSRVGQDVVEWARGVGTELRRLVSEGGTELVAAVVPWAALSVALILAVVLDRRVRRAAADLATHVSTSRPTQRPRWNGVRRAMFALVGAVVVPAACLGLSYVPVRGLFESAAWSVALSHALAFYVAYRVVAVGLRALLGGTIIHVPAPAGRRLLRIAISSVRAIIFFAVLLDVAAAVGWRPEVRALTLLLVRASVTVFGLRALFAYRDVADLLPEAGNATYVRVRAALVRYLPHFLGISVLLLGLWTFGFVQAATTILVRSYAIAGVVVAGALVLRWFDRATSMPHSVPVVRALVDQVDSFARMCIVAAFAAAILGLLGILGPVTSALDAIGVSAGESRVTLLGVAHAVLVVLAAVLVSRALRVLLDHLVYPRMEVEVGAAYAINTALHYFVLALAAGAALAALGVDLRALTVFAGALGVGIGFGLQDFARNIVGGFVLLFGRIIEKGDLVTIADRYMGVVEQIGGRMVRVRTRDNTDLVIPAAQVVGGALVNWTHDTSLVRLHIPVAVAYDSDVRVVEEALIEAARRNEAALEEPKPDVWLKAFGDSAVEFDLLVWVAADQHDPNYASGKILFDVWDVLHERGIEIPFPQRDLHVRSVAPEAAASLRGERVPAPATERGSTPSVDDDRDDS